MTTEPNAAQLLATALEQAQAKNEFANMAEMLRAALEGKMPSGDDGSSS